METGTLCSTTLRGNKEAGQEGVWDENMKTWQNITNEEFFTLAEILEVKTRANEYHNGPEHLLIHSCACMHLAINDYLASVA